MGMGEDYFFLLIDTVMKKQRKAVNMFHTEESKTMWQLNSNYYPIIGPQMEGII